MMTHPPITLLFTGLPAAADKFLLGISTVALVRTGGRTILFDTGPYAYRPILQGRLRQMGIDFAEIDTVVLSHVHWDNAANADLFPSAEIVIHERELAYAEAPDTHDANTPAYVGRALRKLRLCPISGEHEIANEVPAVYFAERIEFNETAGVRRCGTVVAGRILVLHDALERLDRTAPQGLTAKEGPLVELRAVAGRKTFEKVAGIMTAGPLELGRVVWREDDTEGWLRRSLEHML